MEGVPGRERRGGLCGYGGWERQQLRKDAISESSGYWTGGLSV